MSQMSTGIENSIFHELCIIQLQILKLGFELEKLYSAARWFTASRQSACSSVCVRDMFFMGFYHVYIIPI